ncbi:hypothetical protein Cob_v009469 [Colletotrichum orbiculare MAFF 240422]|uniref:DUF5672 domain-containing protein n=2 Tax=Colletotrichum orbiculare species complex TaxID=2707354 RepID=A0A484FI90_COLOR|nr:hypothetical protein Cob_v009469 [Colletotrichum orbiculare MAFF 240422]
MPPLCFLLLLLVLASWSIIPSQASAELIPRDVDEPNNEPPSDEAPPNYRPQLPFNGDAFYISEAMENVFPEHMFRNNNVAVITESNPAAVPKLIPVILHFASVLGPDWPIVLLTLQENWVLPDSIAFRQLVDTRRVIIMFLPPDTKFDSHKAVTYFFVRRFFWQLFAPANRILIFQVDSILCAQSPRKIEEFLEWDFIGAPILKRYGKGYNGGLSIRNPRLMLDIVKQQEKKPVRLKIEDQWFYERLLERKAHMPSEDVAKTFAVETIFYDKPLGYHQPSRYQRGAKLKQIAEWCPEVELTAGGPHFYHGP